MPKVSATNFSVKFCLEGSLIKQAAKKIFSLIAWFTSLTLKPNFVANYKLSVDNLNFVNDFVYHPDYLELIVFSFLRLMFQMFSYFYPLYFISFYLNIPIKHYR